MQRIESNQYDIVNDWFWPRREIDKWFYPAGLRALEFSTVEHALPVIRNLMIGKTYFCPTLQCIYSVNSNGEVIWK